MSRKSSAKKRSQRKSSEHPRGANNNRKHRYADSADVVEISPLQSLQARNSAHQKPLEAKNKSQQKYINAIRHNCLTFGIGPAGTGKSYCAAALAAEALASGRIDKIILTRPAVEAGEKLGFLPGDLDEKFAVYIEPFRQILNQRLSRGTVDYCIRHGRIVASPLAYMRGVTFDKHTFVILDEAQNTTPQQMKMFLTRIGEDCKVVINGDIAQSDIPGLSGLQDATKRMEGLQQVHIHRFDRDDIVRSPLVRSVMERYETYSS